MFLITDRSICAQKSQINFLSLFLTAPDVLLWYYLPQPKIFLRSLICSLM